MSKYRKLPVVIDAIQFKSNLRDVLIWASSFGDEIRWNLSGSSLIIPTLEGNHEAKYGDYIIRGVAGEFYPCKPDIFNNTYELVE